MDNPLQRLLGQPDLHSPKHAHDPVAVDSLETKLSGDVQAPSFPGFFDDNAYLDLHPDVAEAVRRGDWSDGYEHYRLFGCVEGRDLGLLTEASQLSSGGVTGSGVVMPENSIDAVLVSERGGILLIGWLNDFVHKLDYIQITGDGWQLRLDEAVLARTRRTDVEMALGSDRRHCYGFWGIVFARRSLKVRGEVVIIIRMQSGVERTLRSPAVLVDDEKIREAALGQLSNAQYFGNPIVEGVRGLDNLNGGQLLRLNLAISHQIVSNAHVERFGSRKQKYVGSIIVCLYKRPEYLFLQMALFAEKPGIEDYEFIFVSNSPEIAESLMKEARIAYLTYGLDISLVLLPGNAGFGAANNIAARYSRSDRLLVINPDVVPKDVDWAAKHSAIVAEEPPERTKIFGVPLYYDDGSLMHGGMHFDVDMGLSIGVSGIQRRDMIRVEHDGKGAPPWATDFIRSRPVPAVTGAFISVDREWFQTLGGFSEEYIFGHYEDADLCLKSIRQGVVPWLHDIKLWHLEGKGSIRLPVHEAATIVNRWLFSKRWSRLISSQLLGSDLRHPLFGQSDPLSATENVGGLDPSTLPDSGPTSDLVLTGAPIPRTASTESRSDSTVAPLDEGSTNDGPQLANGAGPGLWPDQMSASPLFDSKDQQHA